MKRWFLIDGYNLLHAWGLLQKKSGPGGLEKARTSLLGVLAGAFGSDADMVTVVFDAARAPPGAARTQVQQGIQVHFADGPREADDLIEDLLAHHASPKQVVVVSEDRRLRDAARRRKAKSMNEEQFRAELDKRRRRAPRAETDDKPVSAKDDEDLLNKFKSVEGERAWREYFGEF